MRRGKHRVLALALGWGVVSPKCSTPGGARGRVIHDGLGYADAGSRASGGVTVNCICPGWTETAIIEPQAQERAAARGGNRDAGIAELLDEKQPSRRTSDPPEIGALALWLCACEAHNVTGTSIPVDGGWTAQ